MSLSKTEEPLEMGTELIQAALPRKHVLAVSYTHLTLPTIYSV